MDFLTSRIKPMYFKYLAAAFGSALISSIYGVVDMAMVGQYQGPDGTAALAVVSPVWNIIYSLGLLMGIGGSVMGSVFSLIVMCSHFFTKWNTLQFVKPTQLLGKLKSISVTVFSTFFIDVAMGILTVFFNRQILKYLGTDALSVYGIIINLSTFVQCCAYSIGQASQPILSVNFGTGKGDRIKELLQYAVGTAFVFGIIWTGASLAFPNIFIRIFMTPTDTILKIAPSIIRSYGISFLLLPFNIFSTYYFQAIMKPTTSFVVSVARGAVISGILIMVLPVIAPANAIWFAMPVTELIVAVYAAIMMLHDTRQITAKDNILHE